jgi:hypothetical protein
MLKQVFAIAAFSLATPVIAAPVVTNVQVNYFAITQLNDNPVSQQVSYEDSDASLTSGNRYTANQIVQTLPSPTNGGLLEIASTRSSLSYNLMDPAFLSASISQNEVVSSSGYNGNPSVSRGIAGSTAILQATIFSDTPFTASGGYRNINGGSQSYRSSLSLYNTDGSQVGFDFSGVNTTADATQFSTSILSAGTYEFVIGGSDTLSLYGNNSIAESGFTDIAFSLTPVLAAAVPEPASWGMMILGMGAVGYAMRRRKAAAFLYL